MITYIYIDLCIYTARDKKSWETMLGLPGRDNYKLKRNCGDKARVKKQLEKWRRESRKDMSAAAAVLIMEETDSEDENNNNDKTLELQDRLTEANLIIKELEKKLRIEQQKAKVYHQTSHSGVIPHLPGTTIIEDELEGNNDGYYAENKQDIPQNNSDMNNINNKNDGLIELNNIKSAPVQGNKHLHAKTIGVIPQQRNISTLIGSGLSEILYTSKNGNEIFIEPTGDQLYIREIQCRTEEWNDSWKLALNRLDDASISMQGYLNKMTKSKWNSKDIFDKVQRRWFVLRGNYLTYFKTLHHNQPKADKCIDILNYIVNPTSHDKSKYALELISPPQPSRIKHNKSSSSLQLQRSNSPDHDQYTNVKNISNSGLTASAISLGGSIVNYSLERTKFILIPDFHLKDSEQKIVRNKWIKALRFSTKGTFLFNTLYNNKIHNNNNNSMYSITKSNSDLINANDEVTFNRNHKLIRAKTPELNNLNNNNSNNNNNKYMANIVTDTLLKYFKPIILAHEEEILNDLKKYFTIPVQNGQPFLCNFNNNETKDICDTVNYGLKNLWEYDEMFTRTLYRKLINWLTPKQKCKYFSKNIDVKDRQYKRGKTYKQCFVGEQACDWFVRNLFTNTRQGAIDLGNNWINLGFIEHVTKSHKFKDSDIWYKFNLENFNN